jgi:hypothetical protein
MNLERWVVPKTPKTTRAEPHFPHPEVAVNLGLERSWAKHGFGTPKEFIGGYGRVAGLVAFI